MKYTKSDKKIKGRYTNRSLLPRMWQHWL